MEYRLFTIVRYNYGYYNMYRFSGCVGVGNLIVLLTIA
jgi:hypothetical protein